MADKHEQIVEQVRQDWSKSERGRLFKNNNGTAWWGKIIGNLNLKNNALLIEFPKKITFGLKKGSSDLIGWEYVKIPTVDIVNVQLKYSNIIVPITCSIEIKTKAYPTLTSEQKKWLNNIVNIGGRGYVARETDDGYELREWEVV